MGCDSDEDLEFNFSFLTENLELLIDAFIVLYKYICYMYIIILICDKSI
jgi:hypothetical protein